MKKHVLRIFIAVAIAAATVLSLASCDMLPESITSLIGGKKECEHAEVEWVVDTPSTCKMEGTQHSECKECGAVVQSQVKMELGEHTLGDWEVDYEPTCLKPGSKFQKCTSCKKKINVEQIPTTNTHSYSYGKCTVCQGAQPASAGLEFESNGDGTCTLLGMGTCTDTSLVIPEASPAGEAVVAIAANAFEGESISSVIAPASIVSAGEDCFKGAPIKRATVAASILPAVKNNVLNEVTVIGTGKIPNNALQGLTSLRSVEIGEGIEEIGDSAFAGSSVTSVTMPDSLRIIGASAFANCIEIHVLHIGSGVVEIGDFAFQVCRFLYEVYIPASVTKIGKRAFHNSNRIEAAYFEVTEGWYSGSTLIDSAVLASPSAAARQIIGDKPAMVIK